VRGASLQHKTAVFENIGAVRQRKALHDILLDQEDGRRE
jgi:hypothetical protein